MPFGIDDALVLGGGLLSGLAGGGQQPTETPEQFKERVRQFNLQFGLQQQGGLIDQDQAITGAQRQVENAPLRDKAMYMIMQRLGAVPGDFRGNDAFNPQAPGAPPPSLGGINAEAMQQAAGAYKPGMGGVDPKVYAAIAQSLGLQHGPNGPSVGPMQIPGATAPTPPTPPAAAPPGGQPTMGPARQWGPVGGTLGYHPPWMQPGYQPPTAPTAAPAAPGAPTAPMPGQPPPPPRRLPSPVMPRGF